MFILYQRTPVFTEFQLSLFLLFYFIGTVYLTPDMDTKSEAQKRCGLFCFPYRKLFKHRGISHHWFWGIITRIVYVLVIFCIFIAILYGVSGIESFMNALLSYKYELAVAFGGVFISNLLHIILDFIVK